MHLNWKYLLYVFLYICYVKGQCNTRNYRAAIEVTRPCSKQCIPGSTIGGKSCRSSRVCTCDHECGYSCVPRSSYCPSPPQVENSVEVKVRRRSSNVSLVLVSGNSFKYDDVAEYVCRPGYKRDFPVMQHFCHSRNGWTGNTVCILSCQRYSFSGVARNNMRCGTSCKTDGDCRGRLKCRCDGFCSRSCINPDVNCGKAPAAANAIVKYTGSGIEREAHYTCRDGFYKENGTGTRKCTGGGTWDGQAVVCQRITCGDPRPSIQATGGNVVNWQPGPYRVGQTFTFSCPSTHQMLGSRVRTCLSTGRWSGLLTVCDNRGESIRCRHPGVPINGRITSINLQVGSFVEFQCKPGYSMYGESRQECLYFLQWSDDGAPKCINPKYPLSDGRVIDKLLHDAEVPSIGKSVSSSRSSNHEAYFIIDISDDVRDDVLRNSLEFAEERANNMSRNGRIRCEISAFASDRVVLLDLQPTTTEVAIENLKNARLNRPNILEELDGRRNTRRAIEALNTTLYSSFSEDPDLLRYVFLFVNGPHGQGESPKAAMDNVRLIFEAYLLEIYVVAFGEEFQNERTINELRSLAPKGNFLANPPIELFEESTPDTSEKDYNDCGKAGDVENIKNRAAIGKVIGGSFAIDGAWPWQVVFALYRQNVYLTFNAPISIFGGGSLINNEWVITAAHIFHEIRRLNNWPQNFVITLGTTRLLSNRSSDLSPHTRVFLPDRVIVHENYVQGTFDYDIALVKLGREQEPFGDIWLPSERTGRVEYTKRIQRVCLPCTENNCVGEYLRKIGKLNGNEGKEERCRIEGDWLWQEGELEEKNILTAVTGFGFTDETEPVTSTHLKQGLIRLRNNNRCRRDRDRMVRHTPPLPRRVAFTERMTCGVGGGLNSVVDSCTGDSGGPLVREIIDEESGESCWVLVGIISWGLNCGTSYKENNTKRFFPGFYAKVTSFTTWIDEHISKEEECQERNVDRLEPGYKCRKSCQTTNDCRGGRKRCICDNFCGMSCINPNAFCRGLDLFENGVITGNRIYGSTVTYTCNIGYVLEGANQRTCRSDRTFSGTTPTCRRQSCVVPNAPRFGSVSTNERSVFVGETIRFSCNSRYEMVGRPSRSLTVQCQRNGQWSAPTPTCGEIRCIIPDPPAFGSASPKVSFLPVDGTLTFACNRGYEMVNQPSGRLIVTCSRTKQWSSGVPQCREQRCTLPEAPQFGSISTNKSFFRVNETITFTCDARYEMEGMPSGSLTVQCQRNGEWSDRTPICREIRCIVPITPAFGSVTPRVSSLPVGETITYTCRVGYKMVNQPSETLRVTCLPTKQWSSGVPQCKEIRCKVPSPPQFGSVSPSRRFVSLGTVVTYSCNDGYGMIARLSSSFTITCRRVGRKATWSDGKVPECIDFSKCGQAGDTMDSHTRRVRRALGGENATIGAWPWQVVITLRTDTVYQSYTLRNVIGGGTVVSNTWILTAAHLFEISRLRPAGWERRFRLTLGLGKLPTSRNEILPPYVQVFDAMNIIIHESFDPRIFDYDIALVKVGQAYRQQEGRFIPSANAGNIIQFTGYVRPICLPCMDDSCIGTYLRSSAIITGPEETCEREKTLLSSLNSRLSRKHVATGFGSTLPNEGFDPSTKLPKFLQQITADVHSDEYCRNFADRHIDWPTTERIPYTERMLCASNNDNILGSIDTCQGDSGGPLMIEAPFPSRNTKSCWVQIGLISWGLGCGQVDRVNGVKRTRPGYYANLLNLIPWVKDNLRLRCTVPKPPGFGSVSLRPGLAKVGDVLVYSCNVGYGVEGQAEATCLANGTWSSPPPVCIDLSECGQAGDIGNLGDRARVKRAIGGENARPGAWPWHAVLSLRSDSVFTTYNQDVREGGTVINERWILTAAQLFVHADQSRVNWVEKYLLTLGLHRRPERRSDVLPPSVQVYRPEKIIMNPRFDGVTYDYDVALLKVGQRFLQEGDRWAATGPSSNVTIQFTRFVRPVCLPCMIGNCIGKELRRRGVITGRETEEEICAIEKNFLLRGTSSNTANAVVTGFGVTEAVDYGTPFSVSDFARYLQQVVLQVRDDQYCRIMTNRHIPWPEENTFSYTPRMLCADSSRGTTVSDACGGDSGGPLMREVFNAATKKSCWVQIGIVSWGYGCAQTVIVNGKITPVPGFYANVIELMPWIKETLYNNNN